MCSCIYSFVDSLDHVIRRSVMLLLVNFSKVMKTELKKRQPDHDLLSTLMDLTFSERRWKIIVEGASVKDLMEDYPALSHEIEVRIAVLSMYFIQIKREQIEIFRKTTDRKILWLCLVCFNINHYFSVHKRISADASSD